MQSLTSTFMRYREQLAPVLRESKFAETGQITPDEFVAAGDFLVYKFPTWSWAVGSPDKIKDYLPKEKQYLIQKNVACLRRAARGGLDDHEIEAILESEGDDGDEWVKTHAGPEDSRGPGHIPSIGDIPDVDGAGGASSSKATAASGSAGDDLAKKTADLAIDENEIPDMDDIPDMEDDEAAAGIGRGVQEEEDDDAIVAAADASAENDTSNLLAIRTYDCSITYDKYYRVPRMWLSGYDEKKKLLTHKQIFQDIASDYVDKTVTIEPFPHGPGRMATVHPCKHASVMKKVIERTNASVAAAVQSGDKQKKGWGVSSMIKKATGTGTSSATGKTAKDPVAGVEDDEADPGLRVDQYLIVFLKFLGSITTIEIDSTTYFG